MRGRRNIQSVDTLYGGFWTRFVAWIIDAIIISVVLATIRLAAQALSRSHPTRSSALSLRGPTSSC